MFLTSGLFPCHQYFPAEIFDTGETPAIYGRFFMKYSANLRKFNFQCPFIAEIVDDNLRFV
jgi:hypothetical protein